MRPLVLMLFALTMGCAPTPNDRAIVADQRAASELKLARTLQGFTPGEPQSCLPFDSGRYNTQGFGDTLLYRYSSDVVFRNKTDGCDGVERGDVVITRQYQPRLCRGQIIQTFDAISRNPTGGCTLGDFVPYVRKRK